MYNGSSGFVFRLQGRRGKPPKTKDYNDTYIKSMTILHNFFDKVMVMVQSNAEKKLKKNSLATYVKSVFNFKILNMTYIFVLDLVKGGKKCS